MQFFANTLKEGPATAALLAATTDIAILTDLKGRVLDVHLGQSAEQQTLIESWEDHSLHSLVTIESQAKIDDLLNDAQAQGTTRWRQVNHPTNANDWAVKYCAVQVPEKKQVLFVGQDLGALANLQQQLLEAQNTTERDYWQIRQAETKFRVLFQSSPEAIVIADAHSRKIVDLNPAAQHLIGTDVEASKVRSSVGVPLQQLFHDDCHDALASLLAQAELKGEAMTEELALNTGDAISQTQVALLRQADNALQIIRLRLVKPLPDPRLSRQHLQALEHFEASADAMVITDRNGQIIAANSSFSDLAQIVNVEQAVGGALSNWLGQAQVDLNLLLANLRKHGRVRRYNTVVTGTHGVEADVEISATRLFSDSDDEAVYGFVIRDISLRPQATGTPELASNRSVEELTQLVGRVPLKELVRESADIIERLSIEAALKLTGDNRAAAAEMLGLSRQSLYVKLRRYEFSEQRTEN